MKKQFIYILLFSFFPLTALAQVDALPSKEVGFNIGFLVKDLLKNETDITNLGDRNFILTFKKHYLGKTYFRYGFAFDYNETKDNGDLLKAFKTDFRMGYEYRYPLDKRWQINRGADLMLTYYRASNNFSDEKTRISQVGFVPFVGIQYNINPRVNLSTEAGIGFFYLKQKDLPVLNFFSPESSDRVGGLIKIFTPQELILSISF